MCKSEKVKNYTTYVMVSSENDIYITSLSIVHNIFVWYFHRILPIFIHVLWVPRTINEGLCHSKLLRLLFVIVGCDGVVSQSTTRSNLEVHGITYFRYMVSYYKISWHRSIMFVCHLASVMLYHLVRLQVHLTVLGLQSRNDYVGVKKRGEGLLTCLPKGNVENLRGNVNVLLCLHY